MPYSQKQWQDRIKDAQGNIIQEGTPFSAGNMNRMEQGIVDAHAQLEEAARQKQTLIHGVSVLNGGVDAPVNIEIEGRTLNPMQNTILDPSKYYLLADKKTKLKWSDATIQSGIAKFTAKAERPTLIRVANLEGKVTGQTLENPHSGKHGYSNALFVPSSVYWQETQSLYDRTKALDANSHTPISLVAGQYSQHLFSFDLIAEVERQLGRIPRTTVADKVQWLKDNLAKLTCNWHGFGSSVGGNKATLVWWHAGNASWLGASSHTSGTVGKIPRELIGANISPAIDISGFAHFLAYAEPTDGVTASTLATDYVELEIELKPEAILHAPRVPLYEVTQAHYDAILVTMLEDEILRRYPSAEGATHLQNPYIMAEGENLLPPFSEWALHANAAMKSVYEMELNGTAQYQESLAIVKCAPNTQYTFSVEANAGIQVMINSYSKGVSGTLVNTISAPLTFTTDSNADEIRVRFRNLTAIGTFTFKNAMLTLGATVKPFVPRNQSYALFETKLGSIGGVADRLFEQNAKYFKRKMIEDVIVDASALWTTSVDYSGFKRFVATLPQTLTGAIMTKYNGINLKLTDGMTIVNSPTADMFGSASQNRVDVTVSDAETGFNDAYVPTLDEIKAFFNGWKVKTVDGANKPTAWVSIIDGTDAPTQTLAYVAANKAANYTPYKLSYVLATPTVEEIKSEGAISVNGLTQVEVGGGVIVREKAKPTLNAPQTSYWINNGVFYPEGNLKYRAERILALYKNGLRDKAVPITSTHSNGRQLITIEKADFDTTAEYTVSYLILDRPLFTSNPVNVSAQFANNIRAALEDTTKKVEDNTTAISVNTNIIYDVLKRLKAGGL